MKSDRKLVLEDGTGFVGTGFASRKDTVCEVVFNTSLTGYQEIVSDPSYTDQGVVMSYPLIGNYGINSDDHESRLIAPAALIVRDICDAPSNFRSEKTLCDLLLEADIPGLAGVDTRRLVRSIRDTGTRRALLTDIDMPVSKAVEIIKNSPVRHDAVKRVSCAVRQYYPAAEARFHVVAIDCGMKTNIVRMLNAYGCSVTVVPYDTDAIRILSLSPDGLFISNGPGDPEDVPEVIETLRALRGKLPMFGICLGHQLIALAYGARTYKLKFGHRGGNHPVKDLLTGKIGMTSQNHSYAVKEDSLEGTGLKVSHINLLDNTVEGLYSTEDPVFSVQYHPESAPGPHDECGLFEKFTELMGKCARNGGSKDAKKN
jgi:carbamoyl-phosphate synthase small subunit